MATRRRKIIHAFRRAPDGSAFRKCEDCGVSVAIALLDIHECETKRGVRKRIRVYEEEEDEWGPKFDNQPRSRFCFIMESFKKTCNTGNFIERSREGFNVWKDMSEKERYPYVVLAEKVNSAYDHILLEESNNMEEVDDDQILRWLESLIRNLVTIKTCQTTENSKDRRLVINTHRIMLAPQTLENSKNQTGWTVTGLMTGTHGLMSKLSERRMKVQGALVIESSVVSNIDYILHSF